MQKYPLIFDIQRFSLHDGSGIRTTVFFKGCPLRCEWCHNPEGQRSEAEWMFYADRCINCGRCRTGQLTPETCPAGARELAGREYAPDELMRLLLRDRQCYERSGGGVTFSGGEVLASDLDYVVQLAGMLAHEQISLNIDTCGAVPRAALERILPFTDVFLYDIKCFSADQHRRFTGVDNRLILQNAEWLTTAGARVNVRVPVIPGFNTAEDEMAAMIDFVARSMQPVQVNLLPYHKLGGDKCQRLGRPMPREFEVPSAEYMERLRAQWHSAVHCNVVIGG